VTQPTDTEFDDPTSRPAVAARILKLRVTAGYQMQQDWCAFVGISQGAWSQYETGKHLISPKAALKVAEAIPGVDLNWIYSGVSANEKGSARAESKPAERPKPTDRYDEFLLSMLDFYGDEHGDGPARACFFAARYVRETMSNEGTQA
jgi:hypothetical protein